MKGADAMEKTPNYGLPKWVETDPIKMKPFNDAFADIDKALKANADAVATKAEAETVTAIAQDVGSGGKVCRITTGSYTGNGKTGEANKRTISVDFTPVLVAVTCEKDISGSYNYVPILLIRGCSIAIGNGIVNGNGPTVSWANKSVTWYAGHDMTMMNFKDWTYQYVVIGSSAQ